jgi:tRNA-splicing ligase RtcB (3'-phosphate/5'-hydroxy nucleic acid ligase)
MGQLKLTKAGINKYKLSKIPSMKAEAYVYTTEKLLSHIKDDLSLQQLQEAASLPKVISPVIGMPDIHQGFGLPIGGVMATKGLISVGAVGMDINCGVRLLKSKLEYNSDDFSQNKLKTLINQIERLIPVGLGQKHKQKIGLDLKRVCEQGVEYLVGQNYALKEDLERIEEKGRMKEAEYKALSQRAISRAIKQIGTLGSGNHFIEIQKISKIFDNKIAKAWGLFKNQVCIMVHSGSRALGHQTCNDFTSLFWKKKNKYNLDIPRKGLAALPLDTQEGKQYFAAMAASVNFAFSNRAMMTYFLRQVFKKNFNTSLDLLYDVAHNIAKWEPYDNKWILVHRKGATRALPAGHQQNPKEYKNTGHPAIVPGSMATSSYVLVGLDKNKETFYSVNHGAGRTMSRTQAKKQIQKNEFEEKMKDIVYNKPFHVIADEAPQAYKNIVEVIDTLVKAGLTKIIARLEPLAVIKGD